jgi:hypothetical protein
MECRTNFALVVFNGIHYLIRVKISGQIKLYICTPSVCKKTACHHGLEGTPWCVSGILITDLLLDFGNNCIYKAVVVGLFNDDFSRLTIQHWIAGWSRKNLESGGRDWSSYYPSICLDSRCPTWDSNRESLEYMKNVAFWDIVPYRACANRCLGGKYRLQLQGRKISERGTSLSRWLLKLEAILSSETSVHTSSTRRHIPEDGVLHSHRRENLKSYMFRALSRLLSCHYRPMGKRAPGTHWIGGWVGPISGSDAVERRNVFCFYLGIKRVQVVACLCV